MRVAAPMIGRMALLACLGFLSQELPPTGADGPSEHSTRPGGNSQRQAIREQIRQRAAKPGAMAPSGKVESIGNREITELQYASSDGRKIPAVLSMPKGDDPFSIVVTIHGGQGNRDFAFIRTLAASNRISPTVSALNEQPWGILAISYRVGNGALFGMEQDDVVAGIRFARTLPKIDSSCIGVIGGSHGGHLALIAAEKIGKEFLCVAVGSPWMTDPFVYMTGKADEPLLSQIPAAAREQIMANGRLLYNDLVRRSGLDAEARRIMREHSIETNAEKMVIPSLFLTSLADEQAPHLLVKPTFDELKAAGRDVTVFAAEHCPHGFYWGRDVGGVRIGRGAKTSEELAEEAAARADREFLPQVVWRRPAALGRERRKPGRNTGCAGVGHARRQRAPRPVPHF